VGYATNNPVGVGGTDLTLSGIERGQAKSTKRYFSL